MAVDRPLRRMAAILAADVVGYSRLIGENEEATLAALKNLRAVADTLIADHGGRVFGSAGDSVIAEFASPVEAVRCATEIQLTLDRRNAELPERSRMRFRIGINLGDVVVDGGNLMGDGVNVAARLESLAAPGGICVSETVHMQVRDRLSLDFLDLGEHNVKNIARPIRAYRVPLASEERVSSPFRGLDAFDFEHANLFFGRARAIAACRERLEQLAAGGSAFLLIYGMSGSGKSSLLREELLSRREEIEDQVSTYVDASSRANEARLEKERRAELAHLEAEALAATRLARRTRIAAAVALTLAIGAGAGAMLAYQAEQEALRQAARAEELATLARGAETQALDARNEALRSQSLALAFLSEDTAERELLPPTGPETSSCSAPMEPDFWRAPGKRSR